MDKKKIKRKQVTVYFSEEDPKEKELYEWLNSKFGKNSIIKELLYREKLREETGVEYKPEIKEEKNEIKKEVKKKLVVDTSMIDI